MSKAPILKSPAPQSGHAGSGYGRGGRCHSRRGGKKSDERPVDRSGDGGTEDLRGKKQFKMPCFIGDKTYWQSLVNNNVFGWGTSLVDVALREALARRMTGNMVVVGTRAIQCERGDKRHEQKRFS